MLSIYASPRESSRVPCTGQSAFLEIAWLMLLVGAAEVMGALLLLMKRTRALGPSSSSR